MLSGPFHSMFPEVSFTTPLIWEATRFVMIGDRSVQPNLVSTAACEILLGMCRFGLNYGVGHINAVYDAGMARLYRRCGLTNIELSRYRTAEHGTVFVGLWEISEALEASILAATGLENKPPKLVDREAA
jgi:N-acyl-L-homoserine lactone synthetase